MKRILLSITFLALAITALAQNSASGVVYNDLNGDGIRERNEPGIAGVPVSNGSEIVVTDRLGRYEIDISDDCIIFVIKPSGYDVRVNENNIPQYFYIHKPKGSPKAKYRGVDPTGYLSAPLDFPMRKIVEPKEFKVVFMADTQVSNLTEINYLSKDIIDELLDTDANFVCTLGDNMNNDLSLIEPYISLMGKIGKPMRYVLGNHDMNFDFSKDELSDETFERFYGPAYYAFNYGNVHFIMLDTVMTKGGGNYYGGLGKKQIEFVKNDLKLVPKDKLVVLSMHIPLHECKDKNELFEILKDRENIFAIAGHYHDQENHFYDTKAGWKGNKPLHLLVNGTTSGEIWNGGLDELGIPHAMMGDGAPNGYSIVTFNNNKYSVRYKAARRPDDYQMNIDCPSEVRVDKLAKTNVTVNVFAGSEKSKVSMRIDNGKWVVMKNTLGLDPFYNRVFELEKKKNSTNANKGWGTRPTQHLWSAVLPENLNLGAHVIEVRSLDWFGQEFSSKTLLRVTE